MGLIAHRLLVLGHAILAMRAASAFERFIAPGDYCLRRRDHVGQLGGVVEFHWEMVSRNGEVAAVGLEFLVLAADSHIQTDYQFIES